MHTYILEKKNLKSFGSWYNFGIFNNNGEQKDQEIHDTKTPWNLNKNIRENVIQARIW